LPSIADVYVTVLPETARLKQEIERVVNEAERKRIKLPVEAQTVDADRELARFRTEQERKKIRQKIEIDEADFKKRLELMGKEFEGVGAKLGGALKLNLGLVGIGTLPAMATAITNVAGAFRNLLGCRAGDPGHFRGYWQSSVGVPRWVCTHGHGGRVQSGWIRRGRHPSICGCGE
jgi:hypothetical protein